jgi:hypothetical protein
MEAYYANQRKKPNYKAAIARLASKEKNERETASTWLCTILTKALKDEKSSKSWWLAAPFWGYGDANPSRQLRVEIANALRDTEASPGFVPVLQWFFDQEIVPYLQKEAVWVLAELDGQDAAALRVVLVTKPHPNADVVYGCLRQMRRDQFIRPGDDLQALCQHYRPTVREAARALNQALNGKTPRPFDPEAAMRSAPITNLMKEVMALVLETPPAGARFVVAVTKCFDPDGVENDREEHRGWILKEQGKTVEILTPFGWKETCEKADKPAWDKWNFPGTYTCTVTAVNLEDEVARIESIRKEGAEIADIYRRSRPRGKFQRFSGSLYEAVLAQHLHSVGQMKLAARVLFPALDSLSHDEEFTARISYELGRIYGYQMLTAFVGDRDYAQAEKLAQAIVKLYPKSLFYHYAVRLAAELPKRRDDFVQLKLPTPEQWKEMQKKIPRSEQIDFQCKRVRLLNTFQTGQPFDDSGYCDPQFAEPCWMSVDAAWGGRGGKTEVINPVVEMVGVIDGAPWREEGKKDYKGLALTIADIPQLAEYLREDWTLLCITFERDFAGERYLDAGSRELIAVLINTIANQELCSAAKMAKMSDMDLEMEISRIADWANQNAAKNQQ